MTHHNATNATLPPSLVDTLGTGFRILPQCLPALLIPFVLNVWYWIGPRISVRPVLAPLIARDPAGWQTVRERFEQLAGRPFDVRLDGQWPFWQRLYPFVAEVSAPRPFDGGVWSIQGPFALFGLLVALNIALTLLTALYLLTLSDAVRGEVASGNWLRRFARAWLTILGLNMLVLVYLIVVGIPLLTVAVVAGQFLPLLGFFILSIFIVLSIWLIFTASFGYDAAVISNFGPFRAMFASLLVVRTAFLSAVGLFILSAIIWQGFIVIWSAIDNSLPGLLIALAASAYISTGLTAAHLVFYHHRAPRLDKLKYVKRVT